MGSSEKQPAPEERKEPDIDSEFTAIFAEIRNIFAEETGPPDKVGFEIDLELIDFLEEISQEEYIDIKTARIRMIQVYALGMRAALAALKPQLDHLKGEDAQ